MVAYGLFNFVVPFCWLSILNVKIWFGIRNARNFRRVNRPNYNRLQVSHQTSSNASTSSISTSVATPSLKGSKRHQSANSRSTREASTSIMLTAAYSKAFVIMQTPATFLYVLEFGASDWVASISAKAMLRLEHASNLLIISNSCTNFYIFLLFGNRFRYLVRQRFACCSSSKPSKTIVSFAASSEFSGKEIHNNFISIQARRSTISI